MNVNAIIAEYNPFHKGHKYLIEQSKKDTNADYTIIVMSGNFVQRGAPALLNKYKRTEMALNNGADLVLELPLYYATSSAEYFAMGGVSLLDKLKIVTSLSFGTECADINILSNIAKILAEEPKEYTAILRENLRMGQSFPTARANALLQYDASFQEYLALLSSPNNILGIEYLKALNKRHSSITPYTLLRLGSGYHDREISNLQCSASAIRHALSDQICEKHLQDQIPSNAYKILFDCYNHKQMLTADDFSAILHYKLLSQKEFAAYLDVTPYLSDRICNNLYNFQSFSQFCNILKSKELTYTRISRCLLHILLDMKQDEMDATKNLDSISYARVLGFRREATPLLSAIKKQAGLPLITKLADAKQLLSADAFVMLKRDISKNAIYESTMSFKSGTPMLNEYATQIVIL